jgi:hypothetical protein
MVAIISRGRTETLAKETITRLIDDLDGGEAAETVVFALDGYSYEIDLSAKNATKLRNALSSFIENGSRVSSRAGSGKGAARRSATDRDQNQAIRAWAERKGYEVAPRGRIKQELVDLYHSRAGR